MHYPEGMSCMQSVSKFEKNYVSYLVENELIYFHYSLGSTLTEVTSSGKINMMRNEKYQATNTERVTTMWWWNQFP